MTQSRYKIEYVQPEPVKEKKFRFFGVLGYLWLALLASVFTYGFVYKHISTDEIISYFQNFKTGVVNTDISSLTENSNKTEAILSEEENIISEAETTELNKAQDDSLENIEEPQKLVSEVLDAIGTDDSNENADNNINNNDDELPEDVVFESDSIDFDSKITESQPVSIQTQKQETESIVNEIVKQQDNQETTETSSTVVPTPETIKKAIVTIESEIAKTEPAIQTESPSQEVTIKEEVAQEDSVNNQPPPKEKEVETNSIAKSQETEIDAITAAIREQAEEKAESKENNLDIEIASETTPDLENKAKIEAVASEKKSAEVTSSELAKKTISTPYKDDPTYTNVATNNENNKKTDIAVVEKIKIKETNSTEKTSDSSLKKPAKDNSNTSAVDAIIAAMNAEKATAEEPTQSSPEKTQSEIDLLPNANEKIQNASQLNN